MDAFEEMLTLVRTTKTMLVYGNPLLPAQYLPKQLVAKFGGKGFPRHLIFKISLPNGDKKTVLNDKP